MTAPRLAENFRLVEFDEIASTNEEAKRVAMSGAEDGTLIWAHRQTAGRGRRGREWTSERGNLFLSLVLRPACAPLQAAQLTFVAALAVRDMLSLYLGNHESIACKWPNDVLVGGRKISGILLESSTAGSGSSSASASICATIRTSAAAIPRPASMPRVRARWIRRWHWNDSSRRFPGGAANG